MVYELSALDNNIGLTCSRILSSSDNLSPSLVPLSPAPAPPRSRTFFSFRKLSSILDTFANTSWTWIQIFFPTVKIFFNR